MVTAAVLAPLASALIAFSACPVARAQSPEVPRSGVDLDLEEGVETPTEEITYFQGKLHDSEVNLGNSVEVGSDESTYDDSASDSAAETHTFTWSSDVDIQGHAQVSGGCDITLESGPAWAEARAHAKAEVQYGGVQVLAEDENGLAVTTQGTTQSIGGSVTILGFGGGFQTTWTESTGSSQQAPVSDVDSGGTVCADEAVVTLSADGYLHLHVEAGGKGSASAEAAAGALLQVGVCEHDPV
jgi:hypothetical protein